MEHAVGLLYAGRLGGGARGGGGGGVGEAVRGGLGWFVHMLDFKLGGSRECFVSFLYIKDDFAVGERSRSGCRGCLLGFKLASEME